MILSYVFNILYIQSQIITQIIFFNSSVFWSSSDKDGDALLTTASHCGNVWLSSLRRTLYCHMTSCFMSDAVGLHSKAFILKASPQQLALSNRMLAGRLPSGEISSTASCNVRWMPGFHGNAISWGWSGRRWWRRWWCDTHLSSVR